MHAYANIGDVRIEGIDIIAVRYKTIVESVRKKTYDILDHRKSEFDVDYAEFRSQFDTLQSQIQAFVDGWFEKNLTVCKNFLTFKLIFLIQYTILFIAILH